MVGCKESCSRLSLAGSARQLPLTNCATLALLLCVSPSSPVKWGGITVPPVVLKMTRVDLCGADSTEYLRFSSPVAACAYMVVTVCQDRELSGLMLPSW